MTKKFINKVLFYGSYDTKKYRYVARTDLIDQCIHIDRINLNLLDTTAVYDKDNWITVYTAK